MSGVNLPPRRPLLWAIGAWIVVLCAAVVWSVRNDPPTVAEQRSIAEALPLLERATGQVLAAADAPDRAVELGALTFDRDCDLTPVRAGVEATRDVIVYVRENGMRSALESIARSLPATWGAAAERNAAGTRFTLRADAGDFIGIDTTARPEDPSVTLRVSTGCRPLSTGVDYHPAPVAAGEVPEAYRSAVEALIVAAGTLIPTPSVGIQTATRVEVACPNGQMAQTVAADGLASPADPSAALRVVTRDNPVIRADRTRWAYREGELSVVVTVTEGKARVSSTTACG